MGKKIQILYAKSGFLGHKVIADNYACLLKKLGHDVQVNDVLEVDHNNQVQIGKCAYFFLLKNSSWLWRFLYYYWPLIPGLNWARMSLLPRRFKKTQQLVIKENADIIITTHPIATAVINYLKAKKRIEAELFTTFSDWHTQPFWIFPYVDKFFVVTPQHKSDLINLGFQAKQIEVTGMLLATDFYNAPSKQEARHRLSLPKDRKLILVMGGGQAWSIEGLIRPLDRLQTNAHIIVVGGSDERKAQIERYISNTSLHPDRFVVTGFINPALYFAAADVLISKPGGLTTSQAFLLRLPILLTSPLPGQEDENMRVLRNSHSILSVDRKDDWAGYIDSLLSNQKQLEEVALSASKLIPLWTQQTISRIFSDGASLVNP